MTESNEKLGGIEDNKSDTDSLIILSDEAFEQLLKALEEE